MAVFFAATAPTLFWIQFYHAEENVVIAQALEMRRSGNWLIPTLQGRTRTIKPPLAVWITALAIRHDTLAAIDNPDEQVRAAAYRSLSFQTRYSSLIVTGLMLVAVYELGRAIGSSGASSSGASGSGASSSGASNAGASNA